MVRFSTENVLSEVPRFQGSRGSIVRLKIQDFMTYQDVEMKAGPNVNLVIGPNGTGKSTIVCAICLALAGKPKILGRATNLKEYIRHGATTATIEIELFNPDNPKKNWVVKRIIQESSTGAKSDWFLNGSRSTETSVENLMESLNIQLDNLCQFLPQDRVQDFARMDKIQLLSSTEKSIDSGDGNRLGEKHDRLIEIQNAIKQNENKLKQQEEKLRIESQHNRNLEKEVKHYTAKEKLRKSIDVLKGKKLWLEYHKAMTEFTQLKVRYDDLNVRKKSDEKLLRPLQTQIDQIQDKLKKYRSDLTTTQSDSHNFVDNLKKRCRNAIDTADSEVHRYMAELDSSEKNERDRVRRLESLKEKLRGLQMELDEINQRGDMEEGQLAMELQQIEEQRRRAHEEHLEIVSYIDQDNGEIRLAQHRLNVVQSELRAMSEFRSSRMKYLTRNYPDTARAVEFFSKPENREQANLGGELHEPMILHVYVNDLNYGKIAERCLAGSDLVAFYVEDRDDVQRMLQAAKVFNLGKISVIHHSHPKRFQKPTTPFSEDMMRYYGFQKSLIDIMEVPDYYMSYLCKGLRPQNILIGTEKTDNMLDDILKNTDLTSFYTKTKGYRVTKSHYRASKTTTASHLNDAQIFTDKINASETDRLKETEQKIQRDIDGLQRQLQNRMPRKEELLQIQGELDRTKKDLQEKISYKRKVQSKITQCEGNIANTEAEQLDIANIRETTRLKKLEAQKKLDRSLQVYADSIAELSAKWYELAVFKKQIHLLQKELIVKQNQLEDAKSTVNSYAGEMRALDSRIKVAADNAKKSKDEAQAATNLTEAPADVQDGTVSEDELSRELNSLQTQLNFIPEADAKVFVEYQNRQNRIGELEQTKEEIEQELTDLKQELQEKKESWLGPLKELIQRINHNFGTFFAKIKCVGQISLDQGEDENDFSKYGVMIEVKFRTTEPLQELVGWKQSGGERAITTALYILALQELTSVPFRVIDEINQGMDANNEIRFFELLCSLAAGTDTPQYFLLSPKMLPPVVYPDNVDFHIILNGPHVKVSFKDVIDCKRTGPRQDADEDDDDDSDEDSEEEASSDENN